MKHLAIFAFASAATLLSCDNYKAIAEIPTAYRGSWASEDNQVYAASTLLIISGATTHRCKAEKVLISSSNLVVVCDINSTRYAQRAITGMGINSPAEYRTTYTFSPSGPDTEITHTKYISKGYEGSEGVYTFTLGIFAATR